LNIPQDLNANESTSELTGLKNQAELVRVKTQTRAELEEQKLNITRENESLTVSIKELEKKISDAQVQIESIEQQIVQTEQILLESNDTDQERLEKQQELQSQLRGDLDEAKLLFVSLEGERTEKQNLLNKNTELLQFIEQKLMETKDKVNQERGQFLRTIWIEASDYLIYVVIIVGIIVAYFIAKKIIYRLIQNNQTAVLWAEIIVRGIAFILIIIVFIYAFADRIIGLITLFSVFSAALVVALQDFVSSFFGNTPHLNRTVPFSS
jgi:hypothetical protein